jgi:hypothetical protein
MYAQVSSGSNGVTLVIDADADTIIKRLPGTGGGSVYASGFDLLYRGSHDSLFAYDGASDTAVRRIASPIEGYGVGPSGWDSVGRKLYVAMGKWGAPPASSRLRPHVRPVHQVHRHKFIHGLDE